MNGTRKSFEKVECLSNIEILFLVNTKVYFGIVSNLWGCRNVNACLTSLWGWNLPWAWTWLKLWVDGARFVWVSENFMSDPISVISEMFTRTMCPLLCNSWCHLSTVVYLHRWKVPDPHLSPLFQDTCLNPVSWMTKVGLKEDVLMTWNFYLFILYLYMEIVKDVFCCCCFFLIISGWERREESRPWNLNRVQKLLKYQVWSSIS